MGDKLRQEKTPRGFVYLTAAPYAKADRPVVVQESSAIREYDDAMEKPGSSALWIGDPEGNRAHLDREGVEELVERLRGWLKTGSLSQNVTDPSRAVTRGHEVAGDA